VISTILWLIFIAVMVWILLLFIAAWLGSPRTSRVLTMQRDVDLRLTYKRYMELYPSTQMSYEDYKRLQAQRAYRKAVSSTKIKRMVR
jgi:hypothetical protein